MEFFVNFDYLFIYPLTVFLQFSSERDDWKWFSHRETLFSVNEQRVGFDFEVVLQPGFVSKQALENRQIFVCANIILQFLPGEQNLPR